jgi:hypothetical protein
VLPDIHFGNKNSIPSVTCKIIATLFWATFLVGCGGSGSNGNGVTTNAQLNGSWHVTLTSTASNSSSTLDVFIVQNGATLSSDKVALGSTCSSVGTMSGSVSGNQVNMTVTGNEGDIVSITGTTSAETAFSGSYTTKTSGCSVPDDMGTLSAALIPSVQSASWTGSTDSTQYVPGNTTFTANLAEDASGNITGVLTFTGASGSSSSCGYLGGTPSVTGTQTGAQVSLSDNQADGLGVFGTLDSGAKNFSGSYGVSICNGDDGTFTMSRP